MSMQDRSIDELEVSVRSYHCLKNAHIRTLAQLVVNTEADLLETKNFGRKSVNEIKEVLAGLGLHLGMRDGDDDEGTPVAVATRPGCSRQVARIGCGELTSDSRAARG